jgi:hypothetical protein
MMDFLGCFFCFLRKIADLSDEEKRKNRQEGPIKDK